MAGPGHSRRTRPPRAMNDGHMHGVPSPVATSAPFNDGYCMHNHHPVVHCAGINANHPFALMNIYTSTLVPNFLHICVYYAFAPPPMCTQAAAPPHTIVASVLTVMMSLAEPAIRSVFHSYCLHPYDIYGCMTKTLKPIGSRCRPCVLRIRTYECAYMPKQRIAMPG